MNKSSNKKVHPYMTQYGWIREGVIFGLFNFISVMIIFPLITDEPITRDSMIKGLPFWLIAGMGYSITSRWFYQRKMRKSGKPKEE